MTTFLSKCPGGCPPCGGNPCEGVVCEGGTDPVCPPVESSVICGHSDADTPPALPPPCGPVTISGCCTFPAVVPDVPAGCMNCEAASGTFHSGGLTVGWTQTCGEGGETTICYDASAVDAQALNNPFVRGPDKTCCCGWPSCIFWIVVVAASYQWEPHSGGGWDAVLRVRFNLGCND